MSHVPRRVRRAKRFRGYPVLDDRQERIRERRATKEREALIDIIEAVVWDYAASSGGKRKYRRVHGAYRDDGSPTACAQACELLVAEGRAKVFQQDPTMISIIKPWQPTQAEIMAKLYGAKHE